MTNLYLLGGSKQYDDQGLSVLKQLVTLEQFVLWTKGVIFTQVFLFFFLSKRSMVILIALAFNIRQ